jgi:hypothetical protein
MDNVTIDLGPAADGEQLRGRPATLIGVDGEQRITAEELALRLKTINYEITCALTPRVVRVYHRDGLAVEPIAAGADLAARGEPAWLPARDG